MVINDFKEYLKEGIVKKINPDFERSNSLVKTAERKMNCCIMEQSWTKNMQKKQLNFSKGFILN